jgi:hypothetical protein
MRALDPAEAVALIPLEVTSAQLLDALEALGVPREAGELVSSIELGAAAVVVELVTLVGRRLTRVRVEVPVRLVDEGKLPAWHAELDPRGSAS